VKAIAPAGPLRALASAAAILLGGGRAGGLPSLALVAGIVFAQRLALPLAVLWLGSTGDAAAAAALLGAAALSFVRAKASDRLSRVVRENLFELYLGPFERGRVMGLPGADVATTRLALAFPSLVSWAADGLGALAGGLAALPLVVALLAVSLGPMVLIPLAAAGATGAAVTLVMSAKVEDAWNEAWKRSRALLMNVSASYHGAVELRAHDRAHHAANLLRADLSSWSAAEGRARWLLTCTTWGAFGATLLAALGAGALLGPAVGLGQGPDASYRTWLLVLAAIPTLLTLVSGVGQTLTARDELGRVARQRAEAEAEAAIEAEADEPIDARAELRLEGISYTYPASDAGPANAEPRLAARPTCALRGFHLVLPAGASVALVGANGAGKSTLLYVLLGLVRPDEGRILVAGKEARLDNPSWRRRVAFLSQQPFELSDETVGKNLRVFDEGAKSEDLIAALRAVGLWSTLRARVESDEAALDLRYSSLSRGQAQRVLLARALLRRAELVVLDEPEANLDAASVAELAAIIRELRKSCRVVAAVHDRSLLDWADQVVEVTPPPAT
jgi:ABC-type transport system involved in cytochrome bd biosynthesis fused ATPase/permease subunit